MCKVWNATWDERGGSELIELRRIAGPTGRLLEELLRARGVVLGRGGEGVVNWGVRGGDARPTLNRNCGRYNKYEELTVLSAVGVSTVPVYGGATDPSQMRFPVLGRKFSHTRGTDIIPLLANDSMFQSVQLARSVDFFTSYVPRRSEFRVWVFRRRIKAVYEKRLARPSELRRVGSNHANGFAFEIVSGAPEGLRTLGASAVDALGLDFGAVDILQGVDGQFYVLEVNTAPGVEGPRQGLTEFVESIARWEENGYRRKNGDTPQEG